MSSLNTGGIEVKGITSLEGPLLVIEGVGQVMYDEIVEITGQDGVKRLGNVLEADEKFAVVEVFRVLEDYLQKALPCVSRGNHYESQFPGRCLVGFSIVLLNPSTIILCQ